MLGKSERGRIHGLILATLLHSGGPLLMVFLAERPTPTTRQVSSGGPPPQVLRDPGQPPIVMRSAPADHMQTARLESLDPSINTWEYGGRRVSSGRTPPWRFALPRKCRPARRERRAA